MENSEKFHVRLNAIEAIAIELLEETAKARALLLPAKKQSLKRQNTDAMVAEALRKRHVDRNKTNKKNL